MKTLFGILAACSLLTTPAICQPQPPTPSAQNLYIVTLGATTLVATFVSTTGLDSRTQCSAAKQSIIGKDNLRAFIRQGQNPNLYAVAVCIDSKYGNNP
jgi:hypothetical protein